MSEGPSDTTLYHLDLYIVDSLFYLFSDMHPKHYMLLLLATITLTTTCMVCISIIDSLFNTHTSLSLFHLWDCLDGQSRRLKLGAKLCSPLRIYFRNLSSQFLHVTNLINTHSPARKRPDRFSHTTSTLRKILSSQRGGVPQGVPRRLYLPN